ncbi:MAG TPA: ATP-dependent helicase [Streptosporangiaceae bacterium]|nr:ATP-dependent helicase [Streptosporangiaceae bacterium]
METFGPDADGPEAVLAALDPEQREVALAARGPICVLAGAGTGKTRAIAHRIAYGVRIGVINPRHVLAVTFTTRAAGELRGRLRQLAGAAGSGMEQVQARTFHAAALRQLSHFWPRTVGGRPPAVLDSKAALLTEVARELRVHASPPELRDTASEIEWAKVTQVRPPGYAAAATAAGRVPPLGTETTARLYAGYEKRRRERHLVDFESVLELTAAILAEHRLASAEVTDRYRSFVVDEFQDVNPLQKLLLDTWLAGRDDVCVVGDPRQTIYSFTGATPAYLTGFAGAFPHATVIRLVRNYRSTPQVVALANRLTGAIPGRRAPAAHAAPLPGGAPLAAQRAAGPEPEFTGHDDDEAEAEAVAARAAGLIASGVPAHEIAVLVRINVQTERFERAFAAAGVPCQVRGAERFFERAEVRQALGMLRAAAAAAPDGPTADGPTAGGPTADGPTADGSTAAGLAAAPATEVRHVLSGLGLTRQPPPGRGAARERWESLAALAQLADDYCAVTPGAGLAEVVAGLAHRAAIEHPAALEGVTVTSLHAAKGLEWDVVFLPGLTEGNLPIVHAQTDDAVAEELRLLYVGVTRARERVHLSWALARLPGGRPSRTPSGFLDGLRPAAPGRASGVPATAAERPGRYGAPVPALRVEAPAPAGVADPAHEAEGGL